MKTQNYSNHKMYYPLHHFVFLPLMGTLTALGIAKAFNDPGNFLPWILFGILSFCILLLSVMLRQHYALGNQDRIIRLEFRLRHFELLGTSAKKAEEQLSFSQIAALRFAGDDEFIVLLERALKENISSREIKRSIQHWQADTMRI